MKPSLSFKMNISLSVLGALGQHLQHHTACNMTQPATVYRLQRPTACNATPPATPHRLQNLKGPPVGPKMADGVWKGVYLWVFGHSKQLSQNKFFDPSTP